MALKVQEAATWNFKMVSQKFIMSDFFDSTKKLYGPYLLLWRCPLPESCMVLSIGLCCIVFMPLPKNFRIHVLRNMAEKVQGAATWNFKMVSQKLIMSDFFDSTKIFIWPISFVVEVSLARNVHGVEYWALLYCFYATSLKF